MIDASEYLEAVYNLNVKVIDKLAETYPIKDVNGFVEELCARHFLRMANPDVDHPKKILLGGVPAEVITCTDRGDGPTQIPINLYTLHPILNDLDVSFYPKKYQTAEGYADGYLDTSIDLEQFCKERRRVVYKHKEYMQRRDQIVFTDQFDMEEYSQIRSQFVGMWMNGEPELFHRGPQDLFYERGVFNLVRVLTDFETEHPVYLATCSDASTIHWKGTIYSPKDKAKIMEQQLGKIVLMKLWEIAKAQTKSMSLGVVHLFPYKRYWKPNLVYQPGLTFGV